MVDAARVKTAVITGANTGIGLETARDLAARGYDVVITSRHADRGARAAEDVRRTTGRSITVVPLDLASRRSIEAAAKRLLERCPHIDALVLNAGLIVTERSVTEDGFERMFGVNHLGHFLLTHLLRGRLVASAPARVVVVASRAHRRAKRGLDFDDLQSERRFDGLEVYGKSKLANVYFTRSLARRLAGTGVVVHAVHPGVVATEFASSEDATGPANWYFRFMRPFLRTARQGAATTLHVVLSEEAGRTSGLYFADERPTRPYPVAEDDAAAERLWTESERLLGLG